MLQDFCDKDRRSNQCNHDPGPLWRVYAAKAVENGEAVSHSLKARQELNRSSESKSENKFF
jgi:hypothetical protein